MRYWQLLFLTLLATPWVRAAPTPNPSLRDEIDEFEQRHGKVSVHSLVTAGFLTTI